MDPAHVANAILHIADLPLEVNVQFMTVMATKMPFVGRGWQQRSELVTAPRSPHGGTSGRIDKCERNAPRRSWGRGQRNAGPASARDCPAHQRWADDSDRRQPCEVSLLLSPTGQGHCDHWRSCEHARGSFAGRHRPHATPDRGEGGSFGLFIIPSGCPAVAPRFDTRLGFVRKTARIFAHAQITPDRLGRDAHTAHHHAGRRPGPGLCLGRRGPSAETVAAGRLSGWPASSSGRSRRATSPTRPWRASSPRSASSC